MEVFDWLEMTWTQDTCPAAVLRMPGTSKKGRKKKWNGLERYNIGLIGTYNLDHNDGSNNNIIIIMIR